MVAQSEEVATVTCTPNQGLLFKHRLGQTSLPPSKAAEMVQDLSDKDKQVVFHRIAGGSHCIGPIAYVTYVFPIAKAGTGPFVHIVCQSSTVDFPAGGTRRAQDLHEKYDDRIGRDPVH